MAELVGYRLDGSIATITMDDGKVNALSPAMQEQLGAALDRAGHDRAVVLLTGRPGVFSGGFDLGVLRAGGDPAAAMLRGGFELAARLLSFPAPVVVACGGHAVAMGLFLVLSADYRIGAAGSFRLVANEVAIGLTLPRAAIEIMRQRLQPAALSRAVTLAEPFGPDGAVAAGILDRVVAPGELAGAAAAVAGALAGLDPTAHANSKLALRAATIAAIRADLAGWTTSGELATAAGPAA
jgi:enoyl-CoA hydratase